jgi:hypothetical protein
MMARMDLKKQIFDELDAIDAAVAKLQGSEAAAKKQMDLEIAILKKQVAGLSEKNHAADKKIAESLHILEAFK